MKQPDSESVRYCNCANCHAELLGTSPENITMAMAVFGPDHMPPRVAGRIHGRPYCARCLETHQPFVKAATREDDAVPYQQNAIESL
jgi:hypothetical protein